MEEITDWQRDEFWTHSVQDALYDTGFFTSLQYVLKMTKHKGKFNLLAVVKEPIEDCKGIRLDGFDLVGYDLLDKKFFISAIANCGGFDETFLPSELNRLVTF